ncbi:Arsenite methyltransferase [Penicillium bovifimosum]|uniref:Arsenite methyltransferase n=1 Tax=Penicillium bovifimosum TaxID=126998 RepID=A0A9W9H178_9EURO|nr:Arsenite methyltransferase [Penicillium bovifimosum]KAJ5135729.1 Arsenite methyltransferase [Penicillium bovifimosum]
MDSNPIYNHVQGRYGGLADRSAACEQRKTEQAIAQSFGYDAGELSSIPAAANLGVSCGNPLVLANLREGESVIDLGSGGGIDVLLAAKKVGPNGKVIGVDMTKSMLELAWKNSAEAGATNVSFIEASITSIPLPDASANCIISNCVVNLVPTADKNVVFHEMFRLLKPGGRVAISDILTRKKLPEEVVTNLSFYVGCIAGASQVHEYEEYLRSAGFKDILIVDTHSDINVYKDLVQGQMNTGETSCESGAPSCCGGSQRQPPPEADLLGHDFNEWAGSFKIYAVKR